MFIRTLRESINQRLIKMHVTGLC